MDWIINLFDVAKQPPNFPVQLCYAANGTELLGHCFEGFKELDPDSAFCACDTFNMYNESERGATFEALHEYDPECKPVYRMLYGHPADIYLDRTDNGSLVRLTMDEVCQRAPRLGVEDGTIDTTDPDESFARAFEQAELPPIFNAVVKAGGTVLHTVVTLFLVSTRGWHQGCALATNGAVLPYHVKLSELQLDYPSNRCIMFGDDTYGNDDDERLFAWRAAKEAVCVPLGHRARRDKEACWSLSGTLEHAPNDMPGSPASGRLQGFKAASLYVGETEWVRRQLAAKAASLLGPLDRVDQLQDAGDVENSAQIKNAIVSFSTTGIPNHWLVAPRPTAHVHVHPHRHLHR